MAKLCCPYVKAHPYLRLLLQYAQLASEERNKSLALLAVIFLPSVAPIRNLQCWVGGEGKGKGRTGMYMGQTSAKLQYR